MLCKLHFTFPRNVSLGRLWRDRKRSFEEFLLGNLLSVMVFFNVKTVGFNYCLIDSLNVFTLRCIAALVLATLSDSKTIKDEELFSLISTRRQYYLDSMTLARGTQRGHSSKPLNIALLNVF